MLNTVPDPTDPKVNKEIAVGEGWEVMQKAGIWTSTRSASVGVSTEAGETSNRWLIKAQRVGGGLEEGRTTKINQGVSTTANIYWAHTIYIWPCSENPAFTNQELSGILTWHLSSGLGFRSLLWWGPKETVWQALLGLRFCTWESGSKWWKEFRGKKNLLGDGDLKSIVLKRWIWKSLKTLCMF